MHRPAVVILVLALATAPAAALETDQYYAWTQPLEDATGVLNAKVNLEIRRVLEQVNARGKDVECPRVARRISSRFRFFIFHEIELWIGNTELVDRIPRGADAERDYKRRYLFRHLGAHEMANWVPPSPTVEVDGVRLGTDKLAHFFSEGFWYYRAYVKARARGMDDQAARLRSIDLGIRTERSVLGQTSSGVFSSGDLEANYQGMLFLTGLCEGEAPALERTADGWRQVRPFDWRDYVSPEWDESYQPFALSPRRWKRIRPAMVAYCDELSHPAVRARREAYAVRDTRTLTEQRVAEKVAAGKMPDPASFSIERNCAGESATSGVPTSGLRATAAQSSATTSTASPTAREPPVRMRP